MQRRMLKIMAAVIVLGLSQLSLGASDPDQTPRDKKTMTVAELEKAGDLCRTRKDYPQAIQYFHEAIAKDKKNAILYNKLGMAELKNNDPLNARADFEKATKLNKKYPDAFNNVGAVYFIESNYSQAAKYFKKAVALEETRATFHVNLGAAWFSQKKIERAVNEYSRALELDPQALEQNSRAGITSQITSPEEQAKFYYVLAKIHAKRGDMQACLVCLKKAKEIGYPNLANAYKDEEFSQLWNDPRLAEIVPAPK